MATQGIANSLITRNPVAKAAELIAELVPPREFADATFASYIAATDHPTQAAAKAKLIEFASGGKASKAPGI